MAEEALRLKVDKNIYRQTLDSLDTQLNNLNKKKDSLQNCIDRLSRGDVFGGSDVEDAIKTAKKALQAVKDGISRVMGYRVAIQQQLDGVEKAATTLASDMASIDIPNMFE